MVLTDVVVFALGTLDLLLPISYEAMTTPLVEETHWLVFDP